MRGRRRRTLDKPIAGNPEWSDTWPHFRFKQIEKTKSKAGEDNICALPLGGA